MNRRAVRLALAALCTYCLAAGEAGAVETFFHPEISLSGGYSDNVDLLPHGSERPDQAALAQLRALVGVTGPRGYLAGAGDLAALKYAGDSDRDDTRINATGLGEVELLDDRLFVRGEGVVAEVFGTPLDGLSASPINSTRDRVRLKTYRANPFVRHAVGDWANVETGYAASGVDIGSDGIDRTFTNQITSVATSGKRFSTLSWSATVDVENTTREFRTLRDDDSKRRLASFDSSWAAVQDVFVLIGFGYEDIRDDGLPKRIDGPVGYVGFAYEPNPKTFLRGTAGRRFDRSVFSADAQIELGPRTRIHMGYDESLQTTQRLIRTGLGFLGTDPVGNPIDERSGRSLVVGDPAFGLLVGTFYQKRVNAGLKRVSRRYELELDVFREKRDFEGRRVQDDAYGGNAKLTRRLNRKTTVNIELRHWHLDFGDRNHDDRQTVVGVGFSRELSSSVRVTASYHHTKRSSAESARDLRENLVIFGIHKSFGAGLRKENASPSRPRRRSKPLPQAQGTVVPGPWLQPLLQEVVAFPPPRE